MTTPIIAYSYVRFSHPDQAQGNSLQRQTDLAVAYCKRKGWTLDENLSLRDLGVSAFRGDNALIGNLGVFLDAIKRGTVKPGSALICESIDRISRQGIDEGYDLIKSILKAGVLLVTLSPEREFGPEAVKSLTKGSLEIQLILERAAEESERKSVRVAAAWREKQQRARRGEAQVPTRRMGEGRKILTRRLPAWVEERGGQLVLIADRAAVVKLIFELAAAGYGYHAIIKRLNADGIPAFGERVVRAGRKRSLYSGRWTEPYVRAILNDRRAVGEYQPCKGGKPEGPPVIDYFPPVVTEEEYGLALRGNGKRGRAPTRQSKHINLFSGLLANALGGTYIAATRLTRRGEERPQIRVLIPHGGSGPSFPLGVFEEAVVSMLREINVHDILNGDSGPDESREFAGRLAAVEAELAKVQASLDARGYSETLDNRARKLEDDRRTLAADLADARVRAAHPLSETWGEMQTIAGLDLADPDVRLRLRSALRRMVEVVQLLVVPRGADRLAAVQVWFAGGQRHRDYLIFHRVPRANRSARVEGGWWAKSLATAGIAGDDDLDLRDRRQAAALAKVLGAADLAALWAKMAP
jgi:DNA invertase Pin-like site-specific DNA recombinase